MTTITEIANSSIRLPNNWKKEGEFNADDVLDAYLKGRNDGKSEFYKDLKLKFNTNLGTAISVAEKVFETINENGIHLNTIHLRAENLNNFSVLFVTEIEVFVSERFKYAYSVSRKIKEQAIGDNFYISFSFMPNSKNLNQDCLTADGYFLKYEEK